jgi:hypothetical protein
VSFTLYDKYRVTTAIPARMWATGLMGYVYTIGGPTGSGKLLSDEITWGCSTVGNRKPIAVNFK